MLNASSAIAWMDRLISVAIVLQTVELLQLRSGFVDQGVWSWKVIRREFEGFPEPVCKLLDLLLGYSGFISLLWTRLLSAILLLAVSLVFPGSGMLFVLFVLLLLSTTLILLRWRGTFNGGSDFMTLIVLMALSVASAFPHHPLVLKACLGYIAIQTCASYFISGWIKLKQPNWRSGRALGGFLNSTIYEPSSTLEMLSIRPEALLLASWAVMAFECSFPVALVSPAVCGVYIGLALAFHLANVYVFGLNRFLYAWAAAYPALYYCSQLKF